MNSPQSNTSKCVVVEIYLIESNQRLIVWDRSFPAEDIHTRVVLKTILFSAGFIMKNIDWQYERDRRIEEENYMNMVSYKSTLQKH